MNIHPQAIISPKAKIEKGVTIGPFSLIEDEVVIKKGTVIGPYTVIKKWTTIGENNQIGIGVIIGESPQDVKFGGWRSYCQIGNDNLIREYVTIHRATDPEGITKIGNKNFLMAYSHIAHNCELEDEIVIANYTGLCGYVYVEKKAFISGLVGIHQFVRIGTLSMTGGLAKVVKDIPPYTVVDGNPARLRGLNVIGLKRAGFSPGLRENLKKAYRLLFESNLNLSQAIEKIKLDLPSTKEIAHLLNFISTSSRGILSRKEKDSLKK